MKVKQGSNVFCSGNGMLLFFKDKDACVATYTYGSQQWPSLKEDNEKLLLNYSDPGECPGESSLFWLLLVSILIKFSHMEIYGEPSSSTPSYRCKPGLWLTNLTCLYFAIGKVAFRESWQPWTKFASSRDARLSWPLLVCAFFY